MKIYKVYNGKVESVEVVKETKEFYWFEGRPLAFDCSVRIEKEKAHTTSKEAIRAAIDSFLKHRESLEKKIESINKELEVLEVLTCPEKNQPQAGRF